MTKKDFEAIAEVIHNFRPPAIPPINPNSADVYVKHAMTTRQLLFVRFADKLEQLNPRFDRETFREACLDGGKDRQRV